jgi:hypothetical protein
MDVNHALWKASKMIKKRKARKTVYLDDPLFEAIREWSKRNGTNQCETIRQTLRDRFLPELRKVA